MFWGLVVQPNKKYSQVVSKPFHVSQAVLDVSTAGDSDVQLILTNDDVNYILCILKKSQTVQVPLDLLFSEGDAISFLSVGGTVHLTGYLQDDFGDDPSDIEDEPPQLVQASKSGKPGKVAVEEAEASSSENDNSDGSEGEEEGSDDDDDDIDDEEDDQESEQEEADSEPEPEPKPKKQKISNGVENGKSSKLDKTPHKEKKIEKLQKQEKTSKSTTLQGGVKIEDIRVGNGQPAKAGKKVQVYYEGRLKSNNKIFDKTLSGEGFKFHLGRGEVIKGWDVGVIGMKVGSKRRITCPPNMAYGSKGSPPVIPPNATLVFDVELRGVH